MAIFAGSRRVAAERTPEVRQPSTLPVSAVGGAEAQALQTIGRTVTDVAQTGVQLQQIEQRQAKERERIAKVLEREQEVQDRADATDAMTIYKGALGEKVVEYKSRQQRNAKGLTLAYDVFSQDLFNKTLESLPNDQTKELFKFDADPHNINTRLSVMTHERQETVKSQNAAFSASGDMSVNNAIEDFDNPNTHVLEENNLEEAARSLQLVNGWSKDEKDAYLVDKKSKMFEGIVRQWAVKDVDVAKLSYDKNKDKILGDRQDDIEKLLAVEDVNQKAKIATDTIIVKGKSEKDALAEADNTIENAEILTQTKQNIRLKYADRRRIEEQDRLILNDKATGTVDNMMNDPKQSFEGIVEYINGIKDPTDRRKQMSYFKSEVKKNQTDIVTDNEKYTETQRKVTNGEYKTLTELRRDASPNTGKEDMKSLESLFNAGGRLAGLKDTEIVKQYKLYTGKEPFGEKNSNQYQFFRRYIENQVKALDRNLTQTDLSKWGAEALMQLNLEGEKLGGGFGFGADKTYGEALELGIDVARDWLPNITEDDIINISPILRADGINPTEKNIRVYRKYRIDNIPLEEVQ